MFKLKINDSYVLSIENGKCITTDNIYLAQTYLSLETLYNEISTIMIILPKHLRQEITIITE